MNDRHALRLAVLLTVALGVVATVASAAPAAPQFLTCGKVTGAAYNGSRTWFFSVNKLTCRSGKALAGQIIPKAAAARKRSTLKIGAFTCVVKPGTAVCKATGGREVDVVTSKTGDAVSVG